MIKEFKSEIIDFDVSFQCVSCGSSQLEIISEDAPHYEKSSPLNHLLTSYVFIQKWALCRSCSFVFNLMRPKCEVLNGYYRQGFTQKFIDFNVDNRLEVIRFVKSRLEKETSIIENNNKNASFQILDFGGNDRNLFHEQVEKLGFDYSIEDPKHTDTFDGKYDLVTSYYVFEHVENLSVVVEKIYNSLRENGYLIVEVPDLSRYDSDISGLFFEHLQHFIDH